MSLELEIKFYSIFHKQYLNKIKYLNFINMVKFYLFSNKIVKTLFYIYIYIYISFWSFLPLSWFKISVLIIDLSSLKSDV